MEFLNILIDQTVETISQAEEQLENYKKIKVKLEDKYLRLITNYEEGKRVTTTNSNNVGKGKDQVCMS